MRLNWQDWMGGTLLGLSLAGCGSAPTDFPREPVTGTVTLDGRPLEKGLITFRPLQGEEPIASAVVVEGVFSVDRPDGPAPGPHKVEVWASAPTGKTARDPDDPARRVEVIKSIVPERYNHRTELTAEVKPGGDNAFEFPLTRAKGRGERALR